MVIRLLALGYRPFFTARARYERGVLKPLENTSLKDSEEATTTMKKTDTDRFMSC